MIVVVLLEILIIFRLKTLSNSKTQNTTILISLYFIFLVVMCGLQSWNVPHDSRLLQIYFIELMMIISFIFFLGMIQLKGVIAIFVAIVVIVIVVLGASASVLTVKSYSFIMELFFSLGLHTLKAH